MNNKEKLYLVKEAFGIDLEKAIPFPRISKPSLSALAIPQAKPTMDSGEQVASGENPQGFFAEDSKGKLQGTGSPNLSSVGNAGLMAGMMGAGKAKNWSPDSLQAYMNQKLSDKGQAELGHDMSQLARKKDPGGGSYGPGVDLSEYPKGKVVPVPAGSQQTVKK